MIIYCITNLTNNKKYIGKDSSANQHRWYYHQWAYTKPHVHDYQKVLYRAFRKYKLSNFRYEILEKLSSQESLIEREQFWILHYGSNKPVNGYNRTGAGAGVYTGHKQYVAIDPDGVRFDVLNMPSFCLEHGLIARAMYDVSTGRKKTHRNWQCSRYGEEHLIPSLKRKSSTRKGMKHLKKRTVNSKTKKWELINPNNDTIIIEDLKAFCLDNDLSYRSMLKVSAKTRTHHKKWKIIRSTNVKSI